MKTSTLMTGLPLPAPFLEAFRDAMDRLEDGPLAPAIDVFTTRDSIVAQVALPGVRRQNIEVTVGDDLVSIRGSGEPEPELGVIRHIHRELSHGPFIRNFRLPSAVKVQGAIASLKDGLLTLALPKASKSSGIVASIPVS